MTAALSAHEFAHAVMHTSGQAFMMAFQAGGPHAQDRGLEAVAYAYEEMRRVPGAARWEKPAGKGEVLALDKTFRVVPRGVALAILAISTCLSRRAGTLGPAICRRAGCTWP